MFKLRVSYVLSNSIFNLLSLNQWQDGNVVAANQNVQRQANDQGNFENISLILILFIYIYIGGLIIGGVVAADPNSQIRSDGQGE